MAEEVAGEGPRDLVLAAVGIARPAADAGMHPQRAAQPAAQAVRAAVHGAQLLAVRRGQVPLLVSASDGVVSRRWNKMKVATRGRRDDQLRMISDAELSGKSLENTSLPGCSSSSSSRRS